MLEHGYEGQFAYGYGPRGRDSPAAAEYSSLRTTQRKAVAINYATHALVGQEMLDLAAGLSSPLGAALAASDLVHLHVLHSYMGRAKHLVQQLVAARRPLIWTLHDYWLMTGRCAQPGLCRRWETGCGKCPALTAYPPALTDLTAGGWRERHSWIKQAGAGIQFVAPSRAIASDFLLTYPGLAVRQIYNGVDQEFMLAAEHAPSSPERVEPYYAVIADDLSNQRKVPPALISALVDSGVNIRTAGRASPFRDGPIKNMGEMLDRSALAQLIGRARGTLFLSSVDVFSMALIESLVVGTPVLALPSANALEALAPLGARPFRDESALIRAAADDNPWVGYAHTDRESLARDARDHYSTQAMTAAYAALYDDVLQ